MIRQLVAQKQTRGMVPNSDVIKSCDLLLRTAIGQSVNLRLVFFQVTVYLFEAYINCLFLLSKFKNVSSQFSIGCSLRAQFQDSAVQQKSSFLGYLYACVTDGRSWSVDQWLQNETENCFVRCDKKLWFTTGIGLSVNLRLGIFTCHSLFLWSFSNRISDHILLF